MHDLLYRVALIYGINMIDNDHLETLGEVTLREVVPIAVDLKCVQ